MLSEKEGETEKKWSDGIKVFEKLHPELSLGNINDLGYTIPEDTWFDESTLK
jgi:hypothetical protein